MDTVHTLHLWCTFVICNEFHNSVECLNALFFTMVECFFLAYVLWC